jgi:hypothetical protein
MTPDSASRLPDLVPALLALAGPDERRDTQSPDSAFCYVSRVGGA